MNCKQQQNITLAAQKKPDTKEHILLWAHIDTKFKNRQNKLTVAEVKTVCQNSSFWLERSMRELSGTVERLQHLHLGTGTCTCKTVFHLYIEDFCILLEMKVYLNYM